MVVQKHDPVILPVDIAVWRLGKQTSKSMGLLKPGNPSIYLDNREKIGISETRMVPQLQVMQITWGRAWLYKEGKWNQLVERDIRITSF